MRNRRSVILWVAGLICIAAMGAVRADSWGPPTLEHWSENRKFVLRVGGWGSPKEKATLTLKRVTDTGETLVWTVPTPLDETFKIPVTVFVQDDGRYVVLRDQYHELGHGKVLVFLGEKGQELRAYKLEDLFSQGEILDILHTVSSIHWSNPGLFRFVPGRDQFGFITHWGAIGLFDLTNGKRLPQNAPEAATFRRDALQTAREDLKEGGDVSRGVMLAGLLKDREAIPVLKQLLTDPSHATMITDHSRDNYYGMQLAAGGALVRILGKEAAPLLEARLSDANPSMAAAWIPLIQKTGMAHQSKGVLKLTQHSDRYIRMYAIEAIMEHGGAAIVRRHPQWFRDPYENVRYAAARCLSQKGDRRDIPTLRRALSDRDNIVSLWALRGLIRLKPSDLDAILRRHLDEPEARIALADRGDKAQLRWCVAQLVRYTNEKSKPTIGEFELSETARVLVRHRPAGTEAALRKVAQIPGNLYTEKSRYEAVGLGGLAALGDKAALARVRKIAETAEVFSAVEAVEWLGFVKDRESIPLLRSLLDHREEMLRDEARKALKTLGAPEKESQKSANIPPKETKASSRVSTSSPSQWWFVSCGATVCLGYLVLRGRQTRD